MSKKLPEGITRRGSSYTVRVRVRGEVYVKTWPTLAEAVADRDRVREAGRTRGVLVRPSVTVGAVAEEYLALMASDWRPRTRQVHASEWRSLAPTFARIPLAELLPSEVKAWRAAQTTAPATTSQRLGLLRAILDHAEADYGVPNAARRVKVSRKAKRSAHRRKPRFAYTPADMAKVLASVQDRYRVVVLLLLGLGLRSGEARGLTLDRVDFTTGRITIDRQLHPITRGQAWEEGERIGDTAGFGPPKVLNSERVVMAGADLLDAIREHVEEYGTGPYGLIVTGHRGQPLSAAQWTREVARIRKATGVALVGHDLRHTYGSWAIAAGATIDDVAADLGDEVITVARTYLHPERVTDSGRSDGVLALVTGAPARKPRAKGHLRAV